MVLMENDTFLSELTRLFNNCKNSRTISLTMKRYYGQTKPTPRKGRPESTSDPSDAKCLIRASDGKKKLSTLINAKDVNKFQMAYANILKANMDSLKKRERRPAKGKSKSKATV